MKYFLLRWTFILVAFHRSGDASRYLPMIVWDYRNLLLTCKCNWLTVPKIDIYDQFKFVCPTLNIAVGLLDGQSRSTSEMNENIFRRKVTGDLKNMDNLTKALLNGTFCDRKHNDSAEIFTCKDGIQGGFFEVAVLNNEGYNKGDVFVFFNNGDDGLKKTLGNMETKCTMVLVVNITNNVKNLHDISYGKCFWPFAETSCNNINTSCISECNQRNTSTSPVSPTSTLHYQSCPTQKCSMVTMESNVQATSTTNSVMQHITKSKPTSKDEITMSCNGTMITCETVLLLPDCKARTKEEYFKKYYFLFAMLGILIGVAITCSIFFGISWHKKKAKKCRSCNELRKLFCSNKKCGENTPTGEGFSNVHYGQTSPSSLSDDPESNEKKQNMIQDDTPCPPRRVTHQNRLPSVETRNREEFMKKPDGGSSSPVPVNKDEQDPRCFDLIRMQSHKMVLPAIQSHPAGRSIKKNKGLPMEASSPDTVDSGLSHNIPQAPNLDETAKNAWRLL